MMYRQFAEQYLMVISLFNSMDAGNRHFELKFHIAT